MSASKPELLCVRTQHRSRNVSLKSVGSPSGIDSPKTVDITSLLYDFIADEADDIKCHKLVIDGADPAQVNLRAAQRSCS